MSNTTLTQQISTSMAPWENVSPALAAYDAALAKMFEDVYAIVEPQGSPDDPGYTAGWSTLLDPTACPAAYLPYLAQFVGESIPPGSSATQARQIVQSEQNFQAGTIAGITAAAQAWLTGTQSVNIIERVQSDGTTPDAYHFVLIVHADEVVDATELQNAVDAVKPVGVQWTLIQETSWLISDLEAAYGSISGAEAAFPSIANLEGDEP